MKTLKTYIQESILDDIETNIAKGDFEAAKIAIDTFIQQNYINTKYTISKKPNKDGKYIVKSRGEIKLSRLATSLTNDIFIWGSCGTFNCKFNEGLKNLIGAPSKAERVLLTGCYNLESFEGCPYEGVQFIVANGCGVKNLIGIPANYNGQLSLVECENLISLKGCPQQLHYFSVSQCKNLTTLEGGPKMVEGTFDCSGCDKLTSLKGAPTSTGNFLCTKCNGLKTFAGAPETVTISFTGSNCKNVESLDVPYMEVARNFACGWCDKLKSYEGAPKSIGDTFDGSDCPLVTSLKGLPETLNGLYAASTGLSSLEGCPKKVGKNSIIGVFDIHNTPGNISKKDILDVCNVNPNNIVI